MRDRASPKGRSPAGGPPNGPHDATITTTQPATRVKYGRPLVLLIGVALIVVGLVVALATSPLVGLAVIVIGLFAVVLAAFRWHEFEAQITRALNLRVAHAPAPSPVTVQHPKPDIRVLGIHPLGGSADHVDFRVECVNYGTQQARCTIRASVDGTDVAVGTFHVSVPVTPSATLDLIPDQPPRSVHVLVPRPTLGDLMLPEIPSEPTTLYDRTLIVVASDGGREAKYEWHEPVFDPVEDRARAEVQRRYWRRGRGEETEGDLRMDAIRRHEQRIESGEGARERLEDV